MINAIKQANELGLTRGGQTVVSLPVFISDVHSIGLQAAQGLKFAAAPGRNDFLRATARCRHTRRPASIPPSVTT